jgi:hypothetical protein
MALYVPPMATAAPAAAVVPLRTRLAARPRRRRPAPRAAAAPGVISDNKIPIVTPVRGGEGGGGSENRNHG